MCQHFGCISETGHFSKWSWKNKCKSKIVQNLRQQSFFLCILIAGISVYFTLENYNIRLACIIREYSACNFGYLHSKVYMVKETCIFNGGTTLDMWCIVRLIIKVFVEQRAILTAKYSLKYRKANPVTLHIIPSIHLS